MFCMLSRLFFTLFFDFSPQEAAAAAAAAETEARHLRALEGLMEVGHSALHKLGRLEEEWGTLLPILIKRIVAQYSDIRWVGTLNMRKNTKWLDFFNMQAVQEGVPLPPGEDGEHFESINKIDLTINLFSYSSLCLFFLISIYLILQIRTPYIRYVHCAIKSSFLRFFCLWYDIFLSAAQPRSGRGKVVLVVVGRDSFYLRR